MAEEIAREEEGGPGFCTGEPGITISQHDRTHLAHQQIGEQRVRQQDGEEIHQADEEFLGGRSSSVFSAMAGHETNTTAGRQRTPNCTDSPQTIGLSVVHIHGLSPLRFIEPAVIIFYKTSVCFLKTGRICPSVFLLARISPVPLLSGA